MCQNKRKIPIKTRNKIDNRNKKIKYNNKIEDNECTTIAKMGYKESFYGSGIYEKIIENTNEMEIADEIILKDTISRRIRITVWKTTHYGKEAEDIIYKKIPITDDFKKMIDKTIESIKTE